MEVSCKICCFNHKIPIGKRKSVFRKKLKSLLNTFSLLRCIKKLILGVTATKFKFYCYLLSLFHADISCTQLCRWTAVETTRFADVCLGPGIESS